MSRAGAGERNGRFLAALDAELERLDAKALVVLSGAEGIEPDLAPFVGAAKLGDAFVVVARGHAPRLGYFTPMERDEAAATGLELLTPEALDVVRWTREFSRAGDFLAATLGQALLLSEVTPGRIALAGGWPAGALVEAAIRLGRDGFELVSGTEALQRARRFKSEAELAEVRRVAGVTCAAFRRVAELLAAATPRDSVLHLEGEPLRIARLKREIALLFAGEGLTQPRANIVAPGQEGGVPHNGGTAERTLRANEALVVDLFPKGLLFADCTRTFCAGAPPEALARAHADTLAALELAHARARPGVRGFEIQRAVCALFGERGWPTPLSHAGTLRGYVHNLGHGVGYELHELPSFKQTAGEEDGTFRAGDLVTLEPGLYEPASNSSDLVGFGVRLEDLVVVGEDGVENFTTLPYALDPRAWS